MSPEEVRNKVYIWDNLSDKSEVPKLKEFLKKLIIEQPEPTPYYTKNLTPDGSVVPLKIDWKYLRDKKTDRVIGFVSVITTHPSW